MNKPEVKESFATIPLGAAYYSPEMGIGYFAGTSTMEFAGFSEDILNFDFPNKKLKKSIPLAKIESEGIRPVHSYEEALSALRSLGKNKKSIGGMWTRKEKTLNGKLFSADLETVAEVPHLLLSEYRDKSYEAADTLAIPGEIKAYSIRILASQAIETLGSVFALRFGLDQNEAEELVMRAVLVPGFAKSFVPKKQIKDPVIIHSGYSQPSGQEQGIIVVPDIFTEPNESVNRVPGQREAALDHATAARAAEIKAQKTKGRSKRSSVTRRSGKGRGKKAFGDTLTGEDKTVFDELEAKLPKSPIHKSVLRHIMKYSDNLKDAQILASYFLVLKTHRLTVSELSEKFEIPQKEIVDKLNETYRTLKDKADEIDLRSFKKITWKKPLISSSSSVAKEDAGPNESAKGHIIEGNEDTISFSITVSKKDIGSNGLNLRVAFDEVSKTLTVVKAVTTKPTYVPSVKLGDKEADIDLQSKVKPLESNQDCSFEAKADTDSVTISISTRKNALEKGGQFLRVFFSSYTNEVLVFQKEAQEVQSNLTDCNRHNIKLVA
ncbi:MAG: hypothetical protein AAF549_01140 [Pseudomonadota bacterium]